ncbi:hypothetical protein VC870_17260, partial [Citrobacter freundii]|nr:hypothetical protein [Citrobacter freundii]
MMSLWDALRMNMMISYQELVRTFLSFKLPGAPFTSWLTLVFLLSVLVLMAFDYPNGTYTIASLPLIAILLVAGWFGVRKRVAEIHRTAP